MRVVHCLLPASSRDFASAQALPSSAMYVLIHLLCPSSVCQSGKTGPGPTKAQPARAAACHFAPLRAVLLQCHLRLHYNNHNNDYYYYYNYYCALVAHGPTALHVDRHPMGLVCWLLARTIIVAVAEEIK